MHIGHRFGLGETLFWSRRGILSPLIWATITTCAFELVGWTWLAVPTLPVSLVGVAVAFYLGFKNNASYDRLWEARKIWGAIVNASRSWGFGARDLITTMHGPTARAEDIPSVHRELVLRHVAWVDALRHQLRKLQTWEHTEPAMVEYRKTRVAEYKEDLTEVLQVNITGEEISEVTARINPAAHLLANQSRRLADLRRQGLLDGFAHMKLQGLLDELMAQQGKAERIKNFPFPRQYATVNTMFAYLFTLLVPFAMMREFSAMDEHAVWLTIPFATLVCWVFLTTDKIGDWSENPFEGLANDVPITSMARGIERDLRQMLGDTDLPEARRPDGMILS